MAPNLLKVSSICLIQSVKRATLRFVKSHDFHGRIGAIPYPQEIPGGQWAEFVHSGYVGKPPGSIGAVVYRFPNPSGKDCDWMMSWSNKYGDTSRKVYTEINVQGHYDNDAVWPEILRKLNKGTKHSEARWAKWSATVDEVPNEDCDEFAIFQGIIQANPNDSS
ncbi:23 kDa jasmonate-induced protein-like [Diospyros lotus]|uniref:23 kDa jasmonate-induced protein-like n=1 Tax=Diospyros lotus TaxID=55363 RepID=UPI002259ECC2|nr:23 kDa jasmonate-induced protein-like [Diospyros lotus]